MHLVGQMVEDLTSRVFDSAGRNHSPCMTLAITVNPWGAMNVNVLHQTLLCDIVSVSSFSGEQGTGFPEEESGVLPSKVEMCDLVWLVSTEKKKGVGFPFKKKFHLDFIWTIMHLHQKITSVGCNVLIVFKTLLLPVRWDTGKVRERFSGMCKFKGRLTVITAVKTHA